MKVHLRALGCRLNEAELETWTREFAAQGHSLCRTGEGADLVVVNTCAVTDEAVRKSRQLLRRIHRANPSARLVVSGCYVSLDPATPTTLPGVDLVVANQDKARLVEIVSERFDLPLMPSIAIESDAHLLLARGRQRAFIKVQDGCRYQCTFCIVTQARGPERSRPPGEIVAEINAYHREGIQEVVLTGVHLGGYGSESGSDISDLIRSVLKETAIPRIRLGSLEPWDLPDGFWSLFETPRLMPHLHLPLQSGSDSLLRRMARRCKSDEYRRLLQTGRSALPDLNVSTDIIVGFPGETDDEWCQTMEFVEECGFGQIHIFSFSPRAGTKAAGLPNPVPEPVKRERARALADLAQRLRGETLNRHIGQQFPVLIEGRLVGEGKHWPGYTPNFLRVELASATSEDLCNRILEVEIHGINENGTLAGFLPSPAGGR
ncbi:MAG: tRNA (N(6)-L-threonylcarbamoyladenosine(37)-C(2))-methylthiotransferase MtaB [Gammaproteobacteria bacterium]|nr:tRNA (N(6)-L-threonylcarbamoyladenosine(37)-C(2))-methylthiotransferase MtaB [Gammaproteobacteria bacterium]MBU1654649.1 tRNA (N(6)-L-threonylcarbamoyladenosine(37)-C(2))-methylthiotransferase MtaB [Gammaproteobacteria bacterium]MBU1960442.1 tRNA (N(6)-L-threonylcarbamoyladenosine(37)-C(2))-methylthiotransferase MtaB [Gammaproteobacteria bacterium]